MNLMPSNPTVSRLQLAPTAHHSICFPDKLLSTELCFDRAFGLNVQDNRAKSAACPVCLPTGFIRNSKPGLQSPRVSAFALSDSKIEFARRSDFRNRIGRASVCQNCFSTLLSRPLQAVSTSLCDLLGKRVHQIGFERFQRLELRQCEAVSN